MPSAELLEFLRLRAGQQPAPDLQAGRKQMDETSPSVPDDVRVIAVSAGGVPAEWVIAPGVDESRRLIYFHGGGYMLGSARSHRRIGADLGRAAGCATLVVDYRLAPEAPYPAQLDDALNAYAWAQDNGPSGAGPAKSIFIAGDSAGGGLTLGLLITLRDRALKLPNAAVTLSAWTDMTLSGATLRTRATRDPILADPAAMGGAVQGYLQGADARTPAASPVLADLQGLPPLFMVVGDEEVLLDDTLRVAANASAAGVDVRLQVEAGAFHVYPWFVPQAPESIRAIEASGTFLKAHG